MLPIRLILMTALLAFSFPLTSTAAIVLNYDWTVNAVVPDDDPVGYTSTKTIIGSNIFALTDIEVTLNVSPGLGWNGDLYAYLSHDQGGFSVLLNRIGTTLANPIGSGTSGMDVRFTLSATQDIHTAPQNTGMLFGAFQADGRTADPSTVLDTSPRSAGLSSFLGRPADGNWTLFVADVSGGDTSTINSWGVQLTQDVAAIPEPSSVALLGLIKLSVMARRRRNPRAGTSQPR